jgi:hypothetical protein
MITKPHFSLFLFSKKKKIKSSLKISFNFDISRFWIILEEEKIGLLVKVNDLFVVLYTLVVQIHTPYAKLYLS